MFLDMVAPTPARTPRSTAGSGVVPSCGRTGADTPVESESSSPRVQLCIPDRVEAAALQLPSPERESTGGVQGDVARLVGTGDRFVDGTSHRQRSRTMEQAARAYGTVQHFEGSKEYLCVAVLPTYL